MRVRTHTRARFKSVPGVVGCQAVAESYMPPATICSLAGRQPSGSGLFNIMVVMRIFMRYAWVLPGDCGLIGNSLVLDRGNRKIIVMSCLFLGFGLFGLGIRLSVFRLRCSNKL